MHSVIPFDHSHVRGIRLYGKIDKTSFIEAMRAIMTDIESPGHFNLYLEMEPEEGISGNALWESFKFTLEEGRESVKKIDRIAVVTGEAWLRGWTAIESSLLPGVEERAFKPSQKAEALEWISQND